VNNTVTKKGSIVK